ncbi:MAG: type II secretion system protein [Patescibacteria group bacterium]
MSKTSSFFKRGFTAVEILVVVAVLGIIAAIVITPFGGYRANTLLDSTASQALALLSAARTRTLASRGGMRHGVHLEAGALILFAGDTYQAGAATNEPYTLDDAVEVASITLSGGGSDILFERLTGKTSKSGSFVVRLKSDTTRLRTISVTATGLASVQ